MMKFVRVVTSDGIRLTMHRDVADRLGYHEGQQLTDQEIIDAIRANATYGIKLCNKMIAELEGKS